MAEELARVALWIETVDHGEPLGFLDANLRCGDALLGVFSLEALGEGIPETAYKPLAGDDEAVAKLLLVRNRDDRKGQGRLFGGDPLPAPPAALAADALALRALPEDSEADIEARARLFARIRNNPELTRWSDAADLYTAAFLTPKTKAAGVENVNHPEPDRGRPERNEGSASPPGLANPDFPGQPGIALVPSPGTSGASWAAARCTGRCWARRRRSPGPPAPSTGRSSFPTSCSGRRPSGFDVVLGNSLWECIKLQEQEWFAAREPGTAEAPNAADRSRLIAALRTGAERERLLHAEFTLAKRTAEAASVFARVPGSQGGRFPLNGHGDVNTYARRSSAPPPTPR